MENISQLSASFMGFPQDEYSQLPWSFQGSKVLQSSNILSSYEPSISRFDSVQQNHPNLQSRDALKFKSAVENATSFEMYQNQLVGFSDFSSQVLVKPTFSLEPEKKHSSNQSNGIFSVSSCNSVSSRTAIQSKTRMKWTQELHEQFVECVSRLGGAEKATPKRILKLMNSDGLTISHVKSHLQKHRTAKYIPASTGDEQSDERTSACLNSMPKLDAKTGLQIVEALKQQIDVQRRLCEQLESQRHLQMQIEEQGKQLKWLLDQQQMIGGTYKNKTLFVHPNDLAQTTVTKTVGSVGNFSDNPANFNEI